MRINQWISVSSGAKLILQVENSYVVLEAKIFSQWLYRIVDCNIKLPSLRCPRKHFHETTLYSATKQDDTKPDYSEESNHGSLSSKLSTNSTPTMMDIVMTRLCQSRHCGASPPGRVVAKDPGVRRGGRLGCTASPAVFAASSIIAFSPQFHLELHWWGVFTVSFFNMALNNHSQMTLDQEICTLSCFVKIVLPKITCPRKLIYFNFEICNANVLHYVNKVNYKIFSCLCEVWIAISLDFYKFLCKWAS